MILALMVHLDLIVSFLVSVKTMGLATLLRVVAIVRMDFWDRDASMNVLRTGMDRNANDSAIV